MTTVALLVGIAAASCAKTAQPAVTPPPAYLRVMVPVPVSIEPAPGGPFLLTPATPIFVSPADEGAISVARHLARLIAGSPETVKQIRTDAGEPPTEAIVLALGADPPLGDEGYSLQITAERVTIRASRPAGLFYGVQTLRQLLPGPIEYEAARRGRAPIPVPAVRIVDRPRFAWRGAMLDVARHFFGVDDVKRYIDLMALYKLNRLHLHLADDQGWRIEIKSWPNLTAHGGSTEVGGGPGGFYTQEQYADDRGATPPSASSRSCPRSTCPGTPTRRWRRIPS